MKKNNFRNNFMAIGTDNFRVSVANDNLTITCYDNIVPVITDVHKGNKYVIVFKKLNSLSTKENKQTNNE